MLAADLTNPYTVEVLQGVEAACHALGYMPLICHAANESRWSAASCSCSRPSVEGLIVNALGADEDVLRPLRAASGRARRPHGRRLRGRPDRLDNADAIETALAHLIEHGFDAIHFVVQPFERVSSRRLREPRSARHWRRAG